MSGDDRWVTSRSILDRDVLRRPAAYLDTRTALSGGGLRKPAREYKPGTLRGRRTITLLIHGYNVSKRNADLAYTDFVAGQSESQLDDVVWVYWPGDASTNVGLATVAYPFMINRATNTADVLARHLIAEARASANPAPKDLRIFAHSLGCRVTLELLKKLQLSGAFNVRELVLMAAAVRRFQVMDGAVRQEDLRAAMLSSDRVHIYHSYWDMVLAFAFRPGQMFDIPSSTTTRATRAALGRRGLNEPDLVQGQTEQTKMRHAHGAYWAAKDVSARARAILPKKARQGPVARQVGGRRLSARRVDPYMEYT